MDTATLAGPTTTLAYLCDACTHVVLGGSYGEEIEALIGFTATMALVEATEAMGTIISDPERASRINTVRTACTSCGDMVNDLTVVDYVPADLPTGELLGSSIHEDDCSSDMWEVEVIREREVSAGNPFSLIVVHVNGEKVGEVISSRREDDDTLTARIRVINGHDTLDLLGNGIDLAAAVQGRAPQIIAAYNRIHAVAA